MQQMSMYFKAINPMSFTKEIKTRLAYGYTYDHRQCLFADYFDNLDQFIQMFDHLIYDFLCRCGIRRYIAGNVFLFWSPEERKTYPSDVDYCDALAATFVIYGHDIILYPRIEPIGSSGNVRLTVDVHILDYGCDYINRSSAYPIIRQWVIDDQQCKNNGLNVHHKPSKAICNLLFK